MIENPPLIQIKKSTSRNRPSQKQIDSFIKTLTKIKKELEGLL